MPIGTNLTHCMHCNKDFICGDCIVFTCPECRELGHTEDYNCEKCEREHQERMVRLAEIEATRKLVLGND